MSTYDAVIEWSLRPGDDFAAGRYSRAHTISFDGGVSIAGSASPSVVKAPWSETKAADPEELLVASLAACHMLWFLDFAKHAGVVVRRYRDTPVAKMGKMPNGKISLYGCVLKPDVEAELASGGAVGPALIAELHHKAHDACNIANSVLTNVRVEPAAQAALQGA